MKDPALNFKSHFFSTPFGTLTKRELELKVLQYAISTNIIDNTPHTLAKDLKTTMTKAHSYLTDLALRDVALQDTEAISLLLELLKTAESVSQDSYLQFSIQDARVRIWLELQLSQLNLLQGESLKKDIIKLTPKAIYNILKHHHKIPSDADIEIYFKKNFKDTTWYKELKNTNNNDTTKAIDWISYFNTSADAIKHLASFIG